MNSISSAGDDECGPSLLSSRTNASCDGVDGVDGADGIGVGGLGDLSDVDITNPADGSLIQYNTSTTRWTDQTDISNLGTVTLNGGNF